MHYIYPGQIQLGFAPYPVSPGNLQDVINSNTVNSSHFPEQEMMRLFKGMCLAVEAMHNYRTVINRNLKTQSTPGLSQPESGPSAEGEDDDDGQVLDFPCPRVTWRADTSMAARVCRLSHAIRSAEERIMERMSYSTEMKNSRGSTHTRLLTQGHLPPVTKTELVAYERPDIQMVRTSLLC